jgi:hypothetical protein
MHLK